MKYYMYVSDAKIDMLFAQIPRRLSKRISGDLKVDFKVISLTLRPDTEPATKYGKLKVVAEYLRAHESVGTIALPSQYIEDTEPMRWTVVGSTAVWLTQAGSTMVVLTGAGHHLTGNSPQRAELNLSSLSVMIVGSVARTLANAEATDSTEPSAIGRDVLNSVGFIAAAIHGRKQKFEFMAVCQGVEEVRAYSWAPHHQKTMQGVDRLVLASPLFVALA